MNPESASGRGTFSVAIHLGFHEDLLELWLSRGSAHSMGGVAVASLTQEPVWGSHLLPSSDAGGTGG